MNSVKVVVVDNLDGDGALDLSANSTTFATTHNRATGVRVVRCTSMLSFQRLDVYQRAIEFLALATEIVDDLPRGNSDRADQLKRAAESVVRNIAEGAGRWSKIDSTNRYKIARGEAMECAAALDVLRVNKLVSEDRYERGIRFLEGVVAMLTKMV